MKDDHFPPSPLGRDGEGAVQAIGIELEAAAQDKLATKHDVLALKQDILVLRQDVVGIRHDFEVKLESVKAELVRWVFVAFVATIPTFTGILYFLLQSFQARLPR